MRINFKNLSIFLAFFLLTIQNSQYLIIKGVDNIVEYAGLLILLIGSFQWFYNQSFKNVKIQFSIFIIVFVLMGLGLLFQDLPVKKILYLLISLCLICLLSLFPNKNFGSVADIKIISYSIIFGTFVTTLLALFSNISVFTGSSEGFLSFGFNGGTDHRNYFAYTMITAFIAVDFDKKSNISDKYIKFLSVVLIIIADSRSAYIVFLLYLALKYYKKIKLNNNSHIKLSTLYLILILFGFLFFLIINKYSETFSFRVKGLVNYLNYCSGDIKHLLFGNAEMAFRDSGYGYSYNIQSVIGWDGSVELVLLNILIKNGLVGLIGYIILFVYLFRYIKKNGGEYKEKLYSILFIFIVSAFVESFVSNINYVYSVFSYIIVISVCNIEQNKKSKQLTSSIKEIQNNNNLQNVSVTTITDKGTNGN